MRCDCVLEITYAKPERYQYWQRERVWAEMVIDLESEEGIYRTARMSEVTVCERVRAPRRGDLFRTLDLCRHMDEWLARFADEVRCTTEMDGEARCRVPALGAGVNGSGTDGTGADDRGAGELLLRGTGSGTDQAAAMCDALDDAAALRMEEEMHRLEREALHGLPDLRHRHTCRPL